MALHPRGQGPVGGGGALQRAEAAAEDLLHLPRPPPQPVQGWSRDVIHVDL